MVDRAITLYECELWVLAAPHRRSNRHASRSYQLWSCIAGTSGSCRLLTLPHDRRVALAVDLGVRIKLDQ
jgi:hypothetical protein